MRNFKLNTIILVALSFFFSSTIFGQTITSYSDNNDGKTGSHTTLIGYAAGDVNTEGHNTFLGSTSGMSNTTGSRNTFVGALSGRSNTSGESNTFMGDNSGRYNTTGTRNTFIGGFSGFLNTIGINNTAIGTLANRSNTTGSNNVCLGVTTGYFNTTGNDNIYIGTSAGKNNVTGSKNVCLGFGAGHNETGSNKLHIANKTTNTLIYGDFATEQVAIATDNNYISPGYTLAVGGKIIAEELKVRLQTNWPDYVFAADYEKPTLKELEKEIKEIGHLPNIPSAKEVAKEGYHVGEMDVKLLEKIEELTLYLIEMNKEVQELKEENKTLKKAINQK